MSEEKYADYIQAVLKECPDANPSEVAEAFAKYEEEFYIPPQAVSYTHLTLPTIHRG